MSEKDKEAGRAEAARKLRVLGDRLRAAAKRADELDLKPDLKAALHEQFETESDHLESTHFNSSQFPPALAAAASIASIAGPFAPLALMASHIAGARLKLRTSTCPVCERSFPTEDILHISAKIRGDDILGLDAAQRFHATRFNDHWQALDATGTPCSELACPLCRSKLPKTWIVKEYKAIRHSIQERSSKLPRATKKH